MTYILKYFMHSVYYLLHSVFCTRIWNFPSYFIELHDTGKNTELKTWPNLSVLILIFFRLSINENTFLINRIREHELTLLNIYFCEISYSTVQRQPEICSTAHRSSTDWLFSVHLHGFLLHWSFFSPSKHTLLANRIPAAVLISHWAVSQFHVCDMLIQT